MNVRVGFLRAVNLGRRRVPMSRLVAAIIEARDEADAIRIANDSEFGLGSGVLTTDLARGERIAVEELEAGGPLLVGGSATAVRLADWQPVTVASAVRARTRAVGAVAPTRRGGLGAVSWLDMPASEGRLVLPGRKGISICRRYGAARSIGTSCVC